MKKQKIKKKQLKIENKGITLIALVITIIVLLILAAITISSLIGDNSIIEKANEAVIQTNLGTVKEAYDMYQTENYELSKKDFTKLLKKVPVGEEGEYVYVIQDLSELKLDNLGEYGIGEIPESVSDVLDFNNLYIVDENDNVSYVLDGKIYGGIELAKEEEGEVIYSLKSKAFPGDYISYNCGNGYDGLWQVLYNDDTYGLQIVSSETVGELEIGVEPGDTYNQEASSFSEAREEYNGALDKLNNYCKKYVNEQYATNGRCIGSNPLDQTDSVDVHFKNLKNDDINYIYDFEAMNFIEEFGINILNAGKDYWMSSRGGDPDYWDSNFMYWCIRIFKCQTSELASKELIYEEEDNASITSWGKCSYGIRPVISLKQEVGILSGTGDETNPYILATSSDKDWTPKEENTPLIAEDFFEFNEETGTIVGIKENAQKDENGIGWWYRNEYKKEFSYKGSTLTIPEEINSVPVTNIGLREVGSKGYKNGWVGYKTDFSGKIYFNVKIKLIITEGIEQILPAAFSHCEWIKEVELPNTVTQINPRTFYKCSNLENINIGNQTTEIGREAFAYCEKLETITIPSSVTSIEYDAFSNCTNLKNITIEAGSSLIIPEDKWGAPETTQIIKK